MLPYRKETSLDNDQILLEKEAIKFTCKLSAALLKSVTLNYENLIAKPYLLSLFQ